MPLLYDLSVSLSVEQVLYRQGIANPSRVHPRMEASSRELLDYLDDVCLIESAITYESRSVVQINKGYFRLEGGAIFRGNALSRRLANALEVGAIVCTIGPRLEEKVTDLFAGNTGLKAVLLDGIGNAAVDILAQEACQILRQQAISCGYETSSPLSPGMHDLPLSEQCTICSIAHAERIGVRLNSAGMMKPRKSISMVVGIGRKMPTWTKAEYCGSCTLRKTCRYRVRE